MKAAISLNPDAEVVRTVREGLERAEALRPHVVLLDNRLGSERGMDAIAAFKQLDEEVQVILMTAYGSVSQAVEAMKLGEQLHPKTL